MTTKVTIERKITVTFNSDKDVSDLFRNTPSLVLRVDFNNKMITQLIVELSKRQGVLKAPYRVLTDGYGQLKRFELGTISCELPEIKQLLIGSGLSYPVSISFKGE